MWVHWISFTLILGSFWSCYPFWLLFIFCRLGLFWLALGHVRIIVRLFHLDLWNCSWSHLNLLNTILIICKRPELRLLPHTLKVAGRHRFCIKLVKALSFKVWAVKIIQVRVVLELNDLLHAADREFIATITILMVRLFWFIAEW